MATEHQDNDKIEPAPSLTKQGAARRRLAKVGMGAGVLATLESKSAMASMVCRSPSGSLSNGLAASHYGTKAPACNGLSPGYWKQPQHAWPVSRDLKFTDVFYAASTGSVCPVRAASYDNGKYYEPGSYFCAKLEDMLNPQPFDTNNVGMHLVAAYLNIQQKLVGFLELNDLQTMWSELQTTGRYSPTAGVYWDNAQVANYLASIHD
ncbi:hypothetical protein NX786_07875 [Telluria mixta]|uniref:Uncharacterized protein n=1 Tax=Telluria mixta TaxID=34071 RepID=A0ABT2BVV2_9BURK|nr:hypothetical protein [Telluria mixta]MCS0629247.1 hypothetical protein [Telluria mixta]WEM97684.1 hypothetical protein P0M04_08185 [Telluria mixta]